MAFKLQSIARRRGGQFLIRFSGPDGKAEEEICRLGELRALRDFWRDRGSSVILHTSGAGNAEAEKAARAQFDKTAAAERRETARIEFLMGCFPVWPATVEDLMAFAVRTGHLAPDIEHLSPADAWEALFGETPMTAEA